MTLGAWAASVWRWQGVEAACLTLQDQHGQCVPLLLWALWRLEQEDDLDPAVAEAAVSLSRSMNDDVIAPLRQARRNAPLAERERRLANELQAENVLFERLERLPCCPSADREKRQRRRENYAGTLSRLSAIWGAPLDPSAFLPLIEALSRGATLVG